MRLHAASVLLLISAAASAQGGGFTAGDLYLYSPAIQGGGSTAGALVHVDLLAATATILVDTVTTPSSQGAVCFDPWRQRVVFCGGLEPAAPRHLWAVDAAGQLEDLGFEGKLVASLAPNGAGLIYMSDSADLTAPLKYLDAAGVPKPLLDAAGTAPYFINGIATFNTRGMIFDGATNALFVASVTPCPGGLTSKVNVTRLPLSADGAHVVGPESCAQFEVSTSSEIPVGWSREPGGQLVLVIDSNAGGIEPHILLVDPATLGFSVFASPGSFSGSPALNAGTWSSTEGKVIVLETLNDVLRAFGAGESGAGTTLVISGVVSDAGSSGETASLVEIPPSTCAGGWLPHGVGLAGKGGAVPTLTGAGCAQIGNGITLQVAHGVGGASGTLFVGLSAIAQPFKGGTFYVGTTVLQLGLLLSGAAGVADAGSAALPGALPNDPLLQGVQIHLQVGLHDVAAVKGVSLSNALIMDIG